MPSIRRAVVAAGSSNSGFPFRRMLEAVAALLKPGGPLERAQEAPVETLWQTGGTSTDGLGIEGRDVGAHRRARRGDRRRPTS